MRAITLKAILENGTIFEQQHAYSAVLRVGLHFAVDYFLKLLPTDESPLLLYIITRNTYLDV